MFKLIVDLINKKTYKVVARLIVGSLTLMFLTGIIPVVPGLFDTADKAKADIVIGESTSVDPSYYKDNTNGGIMNLRDVPFSVAISRDKDTYVQVKNGYNIVKSNYKAKFAYEPDSEVWFINENLVYKDPKGFSVADVCSKKISLSRYNPSSGKLNIYHRETYNLSTPKGTVRMPGNAFMIPSSVSVSDPTSLLVFYKQLLKYKNLSDYRLSLSNGKWKNLINSSL